MGEFGKVEEEVVDPQADPLADCCRLSRLKMGVAQADQVPRLQGTIRQSLDRRGQAGNQDFHRIPQQHQVGIVGHKGAGGTEVQDRPRLRAGVAEGVQMGKDIVPHLSLVAGSLGKVDRLDRLPHRRQLGFGDREAEFGLSFGKGQPRLPPEAVAIAVAPNRRHLGGGIACGEGIVPDIQTINGLCGFHASALLLLVLRCHRLEAGRREDR